MRKSETNTKNLTVAELLNAFETLAGNAILSVLDQVSLGMYWDKKSLYFNTNNLSDCSIVYHENNDQIVLEKRTVTVVPTPSLLHRGRANDTETVSEYYADVTREDLDAECATRGHNNFENYLRFYRNSMN